MNSPAFWGECVRERAGLLGAELVCWGDGSGFWGSVSSTDGVKEGLSSKHSCWNRHRHVNTNKHKNIIHFFCQSLTFCLTFLVPLKKVKRLNKWYFLFLQKIPHDLTATEPLSAFHHASCVFYLDDRRRPGDGAVHLCAGNHVGNCIKVVHLVHCHGNRCGRKSNRKQWMGHHHEGQVQSCRKDTDHYSFIRQGWNEASDASQCLCECLILTVGQ